MQKLLERKSAKTTNHEITVITPEIAEAWLGQNTNNRPVAKSTVSRYARDMTNGNWHFTGDPIRFNSKRELVDGQHRLLACVKAGVTFETSVVYGLPDESKNFIDSGKGRRVADVLGFNGVLNSVKVASAARALLDYKARTGGNQWSTADVMDVLERHPKITQSCNRLHKTPRGVPQSSLQFLHYVAANMLDKHNEAEAMAEVWLTGVPAYDNDPMHQLRERFMSSGHISMTRYARISTLYRIWNLFVRGESTKSIRVPSELAEIDGLDIDRL